MKKLLLLGIICAFSAQLYAMNYFRRSANCAYQGARNTFQSARNYWNTPVTISKNKLAGGGIIIGSAFYSFDKKAREKAGNDYKNSRDDYKFMTYLHMPRSAEEFRLENTQRAIAIQSKMHKARTESKKNRESLNLWQKIKYDYQEFVEHRDEYPAAVKQLQEAAQEYNNVYHRKGTTSKDLEGPGDKMDDKYYNARAAWAQLTETERMIYDSPEQVKKKIDRNYRQPVEKKV